MAPAWTFTIPPPENGAFSRESNGQMVAVSPDGRTIAFLAAAPGGKRAIWLRLEIDLSPGSAGTEGAQGLFWKPDSQSVGFYASGKLKSVGCGWRRSDSDDLRRARINPVSCHVESGGRHSVRRLSARGVGGLRHVFASGGTPTIETTVDRAHGETGHLWPYFLPDGQHFLDVVTAEDGGGI